MKMFYCYNVKYSMVHWDEPLSSIILCKLIDSALKIMTIILKDSEVYSYTTV